MLETTWFQPAAVLGGALLAALLLGWLSGQVTRQVGRRTCRPMLIHLHEQCHRSWVATLASGALLVALPQADLPEGWGGPLGHAVQVAAIAAVAWLLVKVLFVAEGAALEHIRIDVENNRRARQMRTQLATLRRLTGFVIGIVAIAAILMTFDTLRTYGASVLASAGLAGVIAGLAAQTTLSNVFAGLQLVFTDALRIDDVVVVEGEWGRIEELTLTYVVVHIWDERRLVLPATYFVTTPFQNWTRSQSRVLGAVELHLDPATPVPELRRKAREVVEANPLWDQRDWVLQVTDMTEHTMVVRVLASAPDAPSAWDLRCDIREALLTWLQQEHPESLPRIRTERVGPVRGPDDGAAGESGAQHRDNGWAFRG